MGMGGGAGRVSDRRAPRPLPRPPLFKPLKLPPLFMPLKLPPAFSADLSRSLLPELRPPMMPDPTDGAQGRGIRRGIGRLEQAHAHQAQFQSQQALLAPPVELDDAGKHPEIEGQLPGWAGHAVQARWDGDGPIKARSAALYRDRPLHRW